jgi:antitoxin component YwqK of YwqJK toxin-antitoxin module
MRQKTDGMKTVYLPLLLIFQFSLSTSFEALASCAGERYSLTELLCDAHEKRSIFICRVDSTIITPNGGYRSYATVLEVFRGKFEYRNIILNTGHNATFGGDKLDANEEYLVFGHTNDGLNFGAFVCDEFSAQLTFSKYKDGWPTPTIGIVRDFFKKQKEGYSGKLTLLWDGKILATGSFKRGKPHGKWQHYSVYEYRRGDKEALSLKSEGSYCKGEYDGEWKQYFEWGKSSGLRQVVVYKNGLELSSVSYCADKGLTYKCQEERHEIGKDGQERTHGTWYYNNGMPKVVSTTVRTGVKRFPGFYADQYAEGTHIAYHDNGQVREKGQYHLGAKVGTWFYYNQFGAPLKEEFFERPDTTVAPFVIFHPPGFPMIQGELENGKPTGAWKIFSETGQLKAVKTFKNGALHGVSSSFRSDKGTIWMEANYENGLQHGAEIHFHEDGKTQSSFVNYVNGKKQGEYKAWFKDGTLSAQGFYENDELHGNYVEYAKPGVLKTKGRYVMGYRHGYFEEAEFRGNSEKGEYFLGQKVGKWEFFYPSGQISARCIFPDKEATKREVVQAYSEDCAYFPEVGK